MNSNFDPENKFSIPYVWGATGIAVNTQKIDINSINSWNDLWNPAYRDHLLLLDDMREVFAMALMALGYSGNTTQPEEIRAAYELLKELDPKALEYETDMPDQAFISGAAHIGMMWNGSAYTTRQENPDINLLYPKEGLILWVDNIALTASAENLNEAYQFINYLLRPEVAAKMSIEVGVATASLKAKKLLDENIANDPLIYPEDAIVQQGEFQDDVESAENIYNKYWAMFLKQVIAKVL